MEIMHFFICSPKVFARFVDKLGDVLKALVGGK